MKIGILGTRGIPNAYGGFEQFAQYLAKGLTEKGHEVWIYNSSTHPYQKKEWEGIHIIHCTDMEQRIGTAGQFVYDFNCIIDSRKRNYDILLQLGYTSNSIWHWLWPKKPVNIVNMDGLEWKRSKYKKIVQRFLKRAEYWAARSGDILIADSLGIQSHLKQEYKKESIYIPYGAEIFEHPQSDILHNWGLQPNQYFLLIARMEPENNIEMIIQGYLQSTKLYPLVIVGNTNNQFGEYLRKTYPSPSIHFTEGIYDSSKINNLRFFSTLYFHGHSVGGTNPSLLEAMACSCKIAAHDNLFNKAILNDCASYFDTPEKVKNIIDTSFEREVITDHSVRENLIKVKTLYNWQKIVDDYENVFINALQRRQG